MMVQLPYTFAYQVNISSLGVTTPGNQQLGTWCLNGYPNIGGYQLNSGGVTVEVPTNFFTFARNYSKCCIPESAYKIFVTYGGSFSDNGGTVGLTTPIIDQVGTAPAFITSLEMNYEGDNDTPVGPEPSGGAFFYPGVTDGSPNLAVNYTGDWQDIQSFNYIDYMGLPHTTVKQLSGPLGGKNIAVFKNQVNMSKRLNITDIKDNPRMSFDVPESDTHPVSDLSPTNNTPQIGVGLTLRAWSPFGVQNQNNQLFYIQGRIIYKCMFSQRRSTVDQTDWVTA